MEDIETVQVGLPAVLPFERPLTYALPEGMQLAPGDWVEVPLGNVVVTAMRAKATATASHSRMTRIARRRAPRLPSSPTPDC